MLKLDAKFFAEFFATTLPIGYLATRSLRGTVKGSTLLAPAAGSCVMVVASLFFYKWGLTLKTAFLLLLLPAILGWFFLIWDRLKAEKAPFSSAVRKDAWIATGIAVLTALMIYLPRYYGGAQFCAVQGNPTDHINYIQCTLEYLQTPSSALDIPQTDAVLRSDPLRSIAVPIWKAARPGVMTFFGLFVSPYVKYIHLLAYPFNLACLFQLGLVLIFAVANLFQTSWRMAAFAAWVFVAGFWGQYIVDVNAWSNLAAAAPLAAMLALLFMLVTAPQLLAESGAWKKWFPTLAVLSTGALFFYPEGFSFHAPAFALGMAWCLLRRSPGKWTTLYSVAGAFAVALLFALPAAAQTFGILRQQTSFAANYHVDWWWTLQSFFGGNDGFNPDSWRNASDLASGVAGLFFATPGKDHSFEASMAARLLLAVFVIGMLAASITSVFRKTNDTPERRHRAILFSLATLGLLASAGLIALTGQLWGAGKGVSFASPYLVIFLLMPLFLTDFSMSRLFSMTALFAAAQLSFGIARVGLEAHQPGTHFSHSYIADPNGRLQLDWNVDRLAKKIAPYHTLAVAVDEPLLRQYLLVYLRAQGKQALSLAPLHAYYDTGVTYGMQYNLAEAEAVVRMKKRVLSKSKLVKEELDVQIIPKGECPRMVSPFAFSPSKSDGPFHFPGVLADGWLSGNATITLGETTPDQIIGLDGIIPSNLGDNSLKIQVGDEAPISKILPAGAFHLLVPIAQSHSQTPVHLQFAKSHLRPGISDPAAARLELAQVIDSPFKAIDYPTYANPPSSDGIDLDGWCAKHTSFDLPPAKDRALVLNLEFAHSSASESNRLTVSVNGEGALTQESQAGVMKVRIPLNATTNNHIELTCDHDDPVSVSDRRNRAIHLRKIDFEP